MLVFLVSCGEASAPTQAQIPTVVPTQAIASSTTPATFIYPTSLIDCNKDTGNEDVMIKISELENADEVRVLEANDEYSLFWADGKQICLAVYGDDVDIVSNTITLDGLSEKHTYSAGFQKKDDYATNWQLFGKASLDYIVQGMEGGYVNVTGVLITSPSEFGPNDAVVKSVWADQKAAIDAAGAKYFSSSTTSMHLGQGEPTPQQMCDEMKRWEFIAPIPDQVYGLCHSKWPIDDSPYDTTIAATDKDAVSPNFQTVFRIYVSNPDPTDFKNVETLEQGQKIGDYTVEKLCVPVTQDDIIQTLNNSGDTYVNYYKDPVGIKLSGYNYSVAVPRGAYVVFGPGVTNDDGSNSFIYDQSNIQSDVQMYQICP